MRCNVEEFTGSTPARISGANKLAWRLRGPPVQRLTRAFPHSRDESRDAGIHAPQWPQEYVPLLLTTTSKHPARAGDAERHGYAIPQEVADRTTEGMRLGSGAPGRGDVSARRRVGEPREASATRRRA